MGWHNQISDGGEPTFLYSVEHRDLLLDDYKSKVNWDLTFSAGANVGYYTNGSAGFDFRMGRIATPFHKHQTPSLDPFNKKFQPLVKAKKAESAKKDCYVWLRYRANLFAYNALLQGQFRDSPVTIDSDQMNRLVHEGGVGVTWDISRYSTLTGITPDLEIFSVDEAFLDVTHCQRLLGAPTAIAREVKQVVYDASGGVLCSAGVSGDKTTAKYAAKLQKPDGLTVIPPWEARSVLAGVPVTEWCGVSTGIGRYLSSRGVHTCQDMQHLPIGDIGQRFGNPGRRIWLMTQGLDPEPIHTNVPAPKSIGHGKVMPPDTQDIDVIHTFLLHMSEKVATRLRRHRFRARTFFIGLRATEGWLGSKYRHDPPTDDGAIIMGLCHRFTLEQWHGEGVYQVQVTALDLRPLGDQLELFAPDQQRRERLNQARDQINRRYGEFALAPARRLLRSHMPNVIAPVWKPFGHRETILNREKD
ncbi:hypothetical protein BOW51_11375 [Solemya velesiana gill symbiont]|uniref:UmuC domain-containing protein n=2 Tax=Solemya velesiana gill symbiont TaxID=1918948 RepID=A0A1T2KRC7_9GAMM|nr:hypothetical protein BOW51_11375 [Solemya velesiana gill symbiont]